MTAGRLTKIQRSVLDVLDPDIWMTVPVIADFFGARVDGATLGSLRRRGLAERQIIAGKICYRKATP